MNNTYGVTVNLSFADIAWIGNALLSPFIVEGTVDKEEIWSIIEIFKNKDVVSFTELKNTLEDIISNNPKND
jgi:hypothetical protein